MNPSSSEVRVFGMNFGLSWNSVSTPLASVFMEKGHILDCYGKGNEGLECFGHKEDNPPSTYSNSRDLSYKYT